MFMIYGDRSNTDGMVRDDTLVLYAVVRRVLITILSYTPLIVCSKLSRPRFASPPR